MNDIEKAIAYLKDAAKIAEKNNLSQEVFEETKGIINTAISALEKLLNGGWVPVSERLPEANKDVQITFREYMNWSKKFRHGICKAIYIPEHSIKSEDMGFDDCDDTEYYQDYDEAEDTYYVKSGWYEIVENWEYTHVYINCEVTAWQPLPKPYKEVNNE